MAAHLPKAAHVATSPPPRSARGGQFRCVVPYPRVRWISNHARTTTLVARIAGTQEGLVTRRQLEGAGVTSRQIDGWVRDGRLHPVFRTVFLLGAPTQGPRRRMRAAALACPGAV